MLRNLWEEDEVVAALFEIVMVLYFGSVAIWHTHEVLVDISRAVVVFIVLHRRHQRRRQT